MNLEEAVKAFLAEHSKDWETSEKAWNQCVKASYKFAEFLTNKSIPHQILDVELDDDHDRYICPEWYPPEPPPGVCTGHCVVFAEGVVIDWTARQYTPGAPYPLIFAPRYGRDRKKYEQSLKGEIPTCDATTVINLLD